MKNLFVGFVGISHLSITYGLAAASKKYKIINYDNPEELENFYDGKKILIKEPGFDICYKKFKKNILFTSSVEDLKKCKILFLSKDILTDNSGKSFYYQVNDLLKKITKFKTKPILVILSQVYPGFTRKIDWPKKKLFYQVETLIFGHALSRASNPEQIIIGSGLKNNLLTSTLENYLNNFSKNIICMNYESAELCKISINAYLISQVSLTNKLNEISKTFNANWKDLKRGLVLDQRIGKYSYINPGLGISGGNLERDLVTLKNICIKKNINSDIFSTFINYSTFYKNWVSREIKKIKKKKLTISIVGITYKINTNSVKNSPSLYFMQKNLHHDYNVYDPYIEDIKFLKKKNIKKFNSINKNFVKSDAIVIFNLYQNVERFIYREINHNNKILIIDPYRLLKKKFTKSLKNYVVL